DAPRYKSLDLSDAREAELLKALSHPNMFWRLTAQRLLVESGNKDIAGKLYGLVRDESLDEAGINPGAMHALWTLHGLGLLDGSDAEALDVARQALGHPAAGVRKAALQVLPRNSGSLEALLNSGVLQDKDMRVRLA